jgi:DNA-binding winged helix-turn-helix (wHTH) protein
VNGETCPRYRFGDFTVSRQRRLLLRGTHEVPLIPRYFDLLVVLIERRHRAVSRRDILDAVWSDVVVSDGALSQAVRSIRRALGDDPREPRFVRTVSRHGYRFVCEDVVEEPDVAEAPVPAELDAPEPAPALDPWEDALARLVSPDEDEAEEAALALHAMGTAEALRRLDGRPGHARGLALLRDTRWDVAGAGPVPMLGAPGALDAARELTALRLRRALRLVAARWTSASAGGALAGLLGGLLGGIALHLAPGSAVPAPIVVTLGLVGVGVGAWGAAGVGAGITFAEATARSWRSIALVLFGSAGGAAAGFLFRQVARWGVLGLFGQDVPAIGGGYEGLALGAAAGLGYGLATPRPEGGMATPHGRARILAVTLTGLCCALAGMTLAWAGGHLAGISLNAVAHGFAGSQARLEPIARLLGDPGTGSLTRIVVSGLEGLLFGAGLALGQTHRPR